MRLETTNACINCENLLRNFMCQKHNKSVEMDNVCESHSYQDVITKSSSCSNCAHFGETTCSKPTEASPGMFCFDWQIK